MDFVHHRLTTGRKLRVLTIVDHILAVLAGARHALQLPRFRRGRGTRSRRREVGFPAAVRVDQGTEFVSRDLDLWAYQSGVSLDFSRPGTWASTTPTENAKIGVETTMSKDLTARSARNSDGVGDSISGSWPTLIETALGSPRNVIQKRQQLRALVHSKDGTR
jgi:hypothetical protein